MHEWRDPKQWVEKNTQKTPSLMRVSLVDENPQKTSGKVRLKKKNTTETKPDERFVITVLVILT